MIPFKSTPKPKNPPSPRIVLSLATEQKNDFNLHSRDAGTHLGEPDV